MVYVRVIWSSPLWLAMEPKCNEKVFPFHTHHHPSCMVCWFTLWPEFPNCRYFDMTPHGTLKHMVGHFYHWVWWGFLVMLRWFVCCCQEHLFQVFRSTWTLSLSHNFQFKPLGLNILFMGWVWKIGYLNAFKPSTQIVLFYWRQ
jgi:hypothetical protein